MGIKRKVCFLIAIILTVSSLFAEERVNLSWSHSDDSVSLYRWRRGDGEWIVTSISNADTSYREGTTETYHIEASYDGNTWSDDHPVIITEAESIYVSWSWISDEGVMFHRWRLNGSGWHVIESPLSGTGTIEIETGERYKLEIQSSYDGKAWSESAESILTTVRAVKNKKGPKLSFEASSSFSLSYAFYDFYNGHDIEGARYLTKTNPGFTADAELALSIGSLFRLYGGYSYSRENKKETVIPDAFTVHHHQTSVGFDVLMPINESWRLYLGLNSAYSVDINAGYWSPSLFFGGRAGLDCFINKNFYVGIKSGIKIAHNDDNDPLYRSFTYLLDPIGIRMGVKF